MHTSDATHCNALQQTAKDCITLYLRRETIHVEPRIQVAHAYKWRDALQRTATRCNMLQHALYLGETIYVEPCETRLTHTCCATHCNTLRQTATHCNTLHTCGETMHVQPCEMRRIFTCYATHMYYRVAKTHRTF